MKFKVGDRVRGTKNKMYGVTNQDMYKGRIVRIRDDGNIDIEVLEHKSKEQIGRRYYYLDPEWFELVDYTYEDLKKSPIGTKITFENGEVFVKNGEDRFESPSAYAYIDNLESLEHYTLGKIIKIEEPEYKTVYEVKPEILDETEKRYLRGVIRPFRDKVKYIKKYFSRTVGKEYLQVKLNEDRPMNLPYFEVNAMYKGMKKEKEYTLEELGL